MATVRRKKRKRRTVLPLVVMVCVAAVLVTAYFVWPVLSELGMECFFAPKGRGAGGGGIYIDSGAERGWIFDRSGVVLAANAMTMSAYAKPALVPSGDDWIAKVSGILGIPEGEIKDRVFSTRNFVWLKSGLSEAEVQGLKAADISGIGVAGEYRRFYPYGGLAVQILGFTDHDGNGLEGVEAFYDKRLGAMECKDPEAPGCSLHLTIERGVQSMAEEEFGSELTRMKGEKGCMIVMGVNTGQILAMAVRPVWEQGKCWQNDQDGGGFSNYAIKAEVDPSMFFVFVNWISKERSSQELQGGSDQGGQVQPSVSTVRTERFNLVNISDKFGIFGPWTSDEIKSVGFDASVLNGMWRLGFGQLTGIDLPDEEMGRLPSSPPYSWDDLLLQGMAASPVQMLRAFCALINGGKLVWPHVAFEYVGKGQKTHLESGILSGGRSIQSAEALASGFREKLGRLDGDPVFSIRLHDEPGSTKGIAQIVALGFWPVYNPIVCYIVVLDNVRGDPAMYKEVFGGIKRVAMAAAKLPLEMNIQKK
ncbi:MAG: penicillin-binding transpeptidase domain-containing protein [Dissulfurimicrobium hydrothermale]|uniref:penicillin-binding transpeptidase domain-containing protein n=1 Tax=Dissulfurimicrobium hydrothermale TaxID=1750598 RepID=UPI003C780C7A